MESNQTIKYALAGLGAVALGTLVWYLSKDEYHELDYKKFNKAKLEAVMKEIQLEFTCIYTRNYNILIRLKESEEFDQSVLDQMETLVGKEIKDKTLQVCEEYCFKCHPNSHDEKCDHVKESIDLRQFEDWVCHFSQEDFIVKQEAAIDKLHRDLFINQRIEHLSFEEEIPEELTADKYLLMYKKIWATIRHDLFMEIQLKKKELRKVELDEKEFDELYNKTSKNFEKIRAEVYSQIMGEEIESPLAREYMQKAYVTYSTISTTNKNHNANTERARWADLVQ
jgi:hypothetical protein